MKDQMNLLLAERSPHKLAGIYARGDAAHEAQREIVAEGRMHVRQVRVLNPRNDADDSDALFRQIEPEGERIPRTLLRTHVLLGISGAFVGIMAFAIAWSSGSEMLRSTPVAGFIAFTFLTAVAGMLIAGLIGLRPDQRVLAMRLQDRLRDGQWAVIAHPLDRCQSDAAGRVLGRSARQVLRTL